MTLQELDSALIESVCARVRARLGEDEAPQVVEFVRQYYRRVPPEDLAELEPLDLYGAALAHLSFARQRERGAASVRVYNPDFEQHGWQSAHTVVELVTDDMPFLVDSTTMELSSQDARIHLLIHPVIRVRRDANGELTAVLPTDAPDEDDTLAESFIRVEIDRVSAPSELQQLRERVLDVLRQVAAAVEDWPAMRGHATDLIAELREPPTSLDRDECEEAAALLAWMDDGHFTFLGFAEYELATHGGEDLLRRVADSGLGILRDQRTTESKLSARASRIRSCSPRPTADRRSTVPPTSTTSASSASGLTGRSSVSGAFSGSTRRRRTARSRARSR
jgi:glutamate dehydrogenase